MLAYSPVHIMKAGADLAYSLPTQADSDDEGEEDESDEPRATDELEHFQVGCGMPPSGCPSSIGSDVTLGQ